MCIRDRIWSGLATYADSMAAIRKLVFDDRKYTLSQINEALKADFAGFDQMRIDCLNAPKYGNDDDYADLIAADLVNCLLYTSVAQIMESLKPRYGGERQFTKQRYLDHVMSLEANGLLTSKSYELDAQGDLSLRYACLLYTSRCV